MSESVATMDEVVAGLTVLVKYRGNLRAAAAELRVTEATLREWAQVRHADRYIQIEEEYGRELEQQIVMEARQTAYEAAAAERAGVQKVYEAITVGSEQTCPRCRGKGSCEKDGEDDCTRCDGSGVVVEKLTGRDLAQATYALSKIKSTNVQNVLALTGRPTNPSSHKAEDAMGMLKELVAMGVATVKVPNQAEPPVEGKVEDG